MFSIAEAMREGMKTLTPKHLVILREDDKCGCAIGHALRGYGIQTAEELTKLRTADGLLASYHDTVAVFNANAKTMVKCPACGVNGVLTFPHTSELSRVIECLFEFNNWSIPAIAEWAEMTEAELLKEQNAVNDQEGGSKAVEQGQPLCEAVGRRGD